MTADDPALSPAEEAAVRARLAEARHTDPVPDHVVARLDGVLADLGAPPTAASRTTHRSRPSYPSPPGAGASSPPGWSPPRPSWPSAWPSPRSSTPRAAPTRRPRARRRTAAARSPRPGPARETTRATPTVPRPGPRPASWRRAPGAGSERSGSAFVAPLALSSDEALRPAVRPLARQGAVTAYDASPGCALDVGAGDRVDATWDGLPAVVVLRPPAEGRRLVEVYVCGSDEVVDSTTLRAP